jgi:hypothetical protein
MANDKQQNDDEPKNRAQCGKGNDILMFVIS